MKTQLKSFSKMIPLLGSGSYLDDLTWVVGRYFPEQEGEFLQSLDDYMNRIREIEKEYQKPEVDPQDFITDGSLTSEEAFEIRRKYLEDEYRQVTRELEKAKREGENVTPLVAKKNRLKFAYETHTYKPSRPDSVTEQEIATARKREVGEFIKLDKRGFAKCPFHNERTPSFKATGPLFYCFGCNEKGDVISFLMKTRRWNFKETIKYLAN